jgi:hypothetical protein
MIRVTIKDGGKFQTKTITTSPTTLTMAMANASAMENHHAKVVDPCVRFLRAVPNCMQAG